MSRIALPALPLRIGRIVPRWRCATYSAESPLRTAIATGSSMSATFVSLTLAFARTGAAVAGAVVAEVEPDVLDGRFVGVVFVEPLVDVAADADAFGLAVVTAPTDAVAWGDATTLSDSDGSSRPQATSSAAITRDRATSRCLDMGTTVAASVGACTPFAPLAYGRVWQDALMADPLPPPADSVQHPELPAASEHPHLSRQRLSDGQAFGLLAAWFVFRTVTQRVGLAVGPKLLDSKPWVIPLLNNSFLLLIQAGTGTSGRPGMLIATGLTSFFMSTIVGFVLYWAGWRFGHRLAHMAQRPGSPWAGVWNPKQIARAERWMDRYGMPVIVVARITEFFILPVTLVAGASEMRFRRFVIANAIGSVGFAGLWLWVGGVAQQRWPGLKDWISDSYGPWALRIGLGLLVVLVIVMALGQWLEKKKPEADADANGDADADAESDQERSTTTPSRAPS